MVRCLIYEHQRVLKGLLKETTPWALTSAVWGDITDDIMMLVMADLISPKRRERQTPDSSNDGKISDDDEGQFGRRRETTKEMVYGGDDGGMDDTSCGERDREAPELYADVISVILSFVTTRKWGHYIDAVKSFGTILEDGPLHVYTESE